MTELNEFSDVSINYAHNRFQRSQAVKKDKLLKNEVLPSIDLCLVMTKTLLNHYQNFTLNYKTRFLHFPMTVDFSRFNVKSTPNIEKNESYLAFCGTSSFRKDGVDIMIKAFAKVVEQFPNNKLKIAAFWGHDGPKMMELIKIHQLNDKVEYVGTVNRDKIPDFLMNAKVLLLPRPDSHQAQGGFPTKLGEYLATGNPVCATRVGEIPDYLIEGESAFLAEPGSVESFADAIMRALSNFEKAKQIGQKGRIIAEDNFNMEAQAKTLYCFLEECLEKKK